MKLIEHIIIILTVLGLVPNSLFGQGLNFYMTSDTLLVMNTNTEYLTSTIENLSADTLVVDIIRVENDMPTNWYSGLCIDICYPAITDSIRVTIQPFATQEFRMYFSIFGSPSPDTAHTKILFRNVSTPTNFFLQDYYALVNPSLSGITDNSTQLSVKIFPNPSNDHIILSLENINNQYYSFTLFDSEGRLVRIITGIPTGQIKIENNGLPSGLYFFQLKSNNHIALNGKLIIE